MKILFQELCLDKIDWDSEFTGTLLLTWNTLLEELKCLYNVRIPRCYFRPSPIEIELHGFSNASNWRMPQLFTCVLSIKMAESMFVWLLLSAESHL